MIPAIIPYGDQAILINFEQKIDANINAKVIGLNNAIESAKIKGITFLIPAYCSLTIGYNPKIIDFSTLELLLKQLVQNFSDTSEDLQYLGKKRKLRIPVCYEPPYALDLADLSKEKDLPIKEIIALHTSQTYKVYLLGFQPCFAFRG